MLQKCKITMGKMLTVQLKCSIIVSSTLYVGRLKWTLNLVKQVFMVNILSQYFYNTYLQSVLKVYFVFRRKHCTFLDICENTEIIKFTYLQTLDLR